LSTIQGSGRSNRSGRSEAELGVRRLCADSVEKLVVKTVVVLWNFVR
jgi:hypothetical protein